MEELIPKEQSVQDTETNQNKFFPFKIQQKLAILIFAALFFLAFGVGAFYLGKQSAQTPILPSVSPTNEPQSTITPTIQPTKSADIECYADADCPRQNASTGYSCINGKCVMDNKNPSSTCGSDNDCPIVAGAGANCQDPNNCNLPVVHAKCVNGYCQ